MDVPLFPDDAPLIQNPLTVQPVSFVDSDPVIENPPFDHPHLVTLQAVNRPDDREDNHSYHSNDVEQSGGHSDGHSENDDDGYADMTTV